MTTVLNVHGLNFGPMAHTNPPSLPPTKSDIKVRFANRVRAVREAGSTTTIKTIFPWQTKLVIQELLALAAEKRSTIRLLTGTATEQIYDRAVRRAWESALDAGCEVRVLVWDVELRPEGSWLLDLADLHDDLDVK